MGTFGLRGIQTTENLTPAVGYSLPQLFAAMKASGRLESLGWLACNCKYKKACNICLLLPRLQDSTHCCNSSKGISHNIPLDLKIQANGGCLPSINKIEYQFFTDQKTVYIQIYHGTSFAYGYECQFYPI